MTKRVALVTGGMGGLGTAICKALAKDGYTVVANCLSGFPAEGRVAGQDARLKVST
jgi:acetoacetyl-CoA reductase